MAGLPEYTASHPFVNVLHPVYAVMTDEDKETYGEVKAIAPLMSIKRQTKTDSGTLYGDGELQESSSDMGETTVDFEVNGITLATVAELRGHAFDATAGKMTVREDDVVPYIALGYAVKKSDGKCRCTWLMKGHIDEPDLDAKQKEGKTNFSTASLSGTFITRAVDSVRYDSIDEAEGSTKYDAYLSAVPTTFASRATTTTTGA